jgi:hypothetical protein
VEATLEDPRQVLKAQQRQARDEAMQEMKADGLEYEERMERLQNVTYPQPLKELLGQAFDQYRRDIPWASDYELKPKSVLRDMLETASDFNSYISRYNISRSEGTLLRYLSDSYRALSHTVPDNKLNDHLRDIISWLKLVVRSVDSSLVDEWEATNSDNLNAASVLDLTHAGDKKRVVQDRIGLMILVRNALFHRVELVAYDKPEELAALDADWGYGLRTWQDTLDELYDEHVEINTDAGARSVDFFKVDDSQETSEHVWRVQQTFDDIEGDRDWGIAGILDIDATQDEGQAVFVEYHVGPIEELLKV